GVAVLPQVDRSGALAVLVVLGPRGREVVPVQAGLPIDAVGGGLNPIAVRVVGGGRAVNPLLVQTGPGIGAEKGTPDEVAGPAERGGDAREAFSGDHRIPRGIPAHP